MSGVFFIQNLSGNRKAKRRSFPQRLCLISTLYQRSAGRDRYFLLPSLIGDWDRKPWLARSCFNLALCSIGPLRRLCHRNGPFKSVSSAIRRRRDVSLASFNEIFAKFAVGFGIVLIIFSSRNRRYGQILLLTGAVFGLFNAIDFFSHPII